jgi:hypothetical protein
VIQYTLHVGIAALLQADSPSHRWSAFFEDDGETGYLYAVDPERADNSILDAVHIYNVASVVDRQKPSVLSIVWSADESKCALLINDYPHAVFDFASKRGYCRTNFPNFQDSPEGGWLKSDHSWLDEAAMWLANNSS